MDSCKPESTIPSMVMPDLPDGDGFLVSFFNICIPSNGKRILILGTVINGVISLPIAILAYFFLPDTPGTAKANWLFSERVSIVRLSNEQRQ